MARPETEARPLRIHQSIAKQLGTAILTGQYKPGDNLEGEIENSLALGVSRTPYREAIRILVSKGLLESKPKAGTRITPRQRWNLLDPDLLSWMFTSQPGPHFIRDLFELRRILEPAAAALAAERRTSEQLRRMNTALEQMRARGLASDAGKEADRLFHHAILEASGNEALASLSSSVGAAVQWTTHFKQRVHANPRDPLPEHLAVYEAIAASNVVEASAAMHTLLRLALQDMRINET